MKAVTKTWASVFGADNQSGCFRAGAAHDFVACERQRGKVIYPAQEFVYRAFQLTEFDRVKVVILGQDPYHGLGQANGLAFSVDSHVKIPPSLANIYKEVQRDIGGQPRLHGDLTDWAKQGVLLLNTVLTVEAGTAHSHRGKGWEVFTDSIIKTLSHKRQHVVFLLWGKPAQAKASLIDSRHTVLCAPHPSPLSAYRGFLGCGHFSLANQALVAHKQSPVLWLSN